MGMDVYGVAATSEAGEYFRKNVWGWHPLWNLCEELSPEMTGTVKYAHSNDGDGLNGADARQLGRVLWDALWDGRVDAFVQREVQTDGDDPASAYATNRESVQVFALFLRDCGGFEIW